MRGNSDVIASIEAYQLEPLEAETQSSPLCLDNAIAEALVGRIYSSSSQKSTRVIQEKAG
jgi:hypothetical protein